MQAFKTRIRVFTAFIFIFAALLFLPSLALANSANVTSNNSTPAADGQTVSVINIDVNDDSSNPVGSGDQITLTNTNSDSGLNIIDNNNGTCNGSSRTTSSQAATGSDGSGTPGNEVQFGVCSTNAGTDTFDVSDSSGNVGSINISFQATSVTPTPTPEASTSCTDATPGGTPQLNSAVTNGNNQIILTWTDAPDPVSNYLISYGLESGKYIYGNPNVGGQGTTTYTVGALSPGTTYYFVVEANNGCTSGDYSNEVSATTTGSSGTVLSANSDTSSDTSTPSVTPSVTPNPTPTPSAVSVTPTQAVSSSGISKKIIAVFVIIVVGIIAALGLFVYKKRKNKVFDSSRESPGI